MINRILYIITAVLTFIITACDNGDMELPYTNTAGRVVTLEDGRLLIPLTVNTDFDIVETRATEATAKEKKIETIFALVFDAATGKKIEHVAGNVIVGQLTHNVEVILTPN
ncbi:MAG: hypothetical protein ACRDDZ_02435, partial [Marinifilaceae bacterium]